jgi:hypothetical protein
VSKNETVRTEHRDLPMAVLEQLFEYIVASMSPGMEDKMAQERDFDKLEEYIVLYQKK